MFFVNHVYRGREPYRVQKIQKDKQDDQSGRGHQFNDEDEAEIHAKFLKAQEKFFKKRAVATAQEIMNRRLITLKDDLSL